MLAKVSRISFTIGIIFFTTLLGCSCRNNSDDIGTDIASNLKIDRFDSDLTSSPGDSVDVRFARLKKQYGNFFNRFIDDIIHINFGDSTVLLMEFQRFLNDPDFNEVNNAVRDTFRDISGPEKTISSALGRYKQYFPEKTTPRLITFVSLFNYGIICTDSVLGIGLDMYLGSQSKYYPALGFPSFKIRKMRKEYIPADAIHAWVDSDFDPEGTNHDFLTHMIHQGKVRYLVKTLMPEQHDTLVSGYSASQLQWCYENEKNIWAFFVEKKLLFSSDMELFSKYLGEGPTTNGFPAESPGNIGSFVGWQIIKSYMEENPETSAAQLMKLSDASIVLKESKYKPKK